VRCPVAQSVLVTDGGAEVLLGGHELLGEGTLAPLGIPRFRDDSRVGYRASERLVTAVGGAVQPGRDLAGQHPAEPEMLDGVQMLVLASVSCSAAVAFSL